MTVIKSIVVHDRKFPTPAVFDICGGTMERSVEKIDLCATILGWTTYGSDLGSLDHYFLNFAMAARLDR